MLGIIFLHVLWGCKVPCMLICHSYAWPPLQTRYYRLKLPKPHYINNITYPSPLNYFIVGRPPSFSSFFFFLITLHSLARVIQLVWSFYENPSSFPPLHNHVIFIKINQKFGRNHHLHSRRQEVFLEGK